MDHSTALLPADPSPTFLSSAVAEQWGWGGEGGSALGTLGSCNIFLTQYLLMGPLAPRASFQQETWLEIYLYGKALTFLLIPGSALLSCFLLLWL